MIIQKVQMESCQLTSHDRESPSREFLDCTYLFWTFVTLLRPVFFQIRLQYLCRNFGNCVGIVVNAFILSSRCVLHDDAENADLKSDKCMIKESTQMPSSFKIAQDTAIARMASTFM